MLGELGAHAIGLGVGLVDLVHRDDDRHAGRACACWIASMVCGMTPSSAATTSTTTSVALAPRARMAVNAAWPGRIEERDHAFRRFHVVRADVLRDAARFARRHLRAADVVEQRGLAVVDVTHDGDDRRTRLGTRSRALFALQIFFDLVALEHLGDVAHLFDHQRRGVADRSAG